MDFHTEHCRRRTYPPRGVRDAQIRLQHDLGYVSARSWDTVNRTKSLPSRGFCGMKLLRKYPPFLLSVMNTFLPFLYWMLLSIMEYAVLQGTQNTWNALLPLVPDFGELWLPRKIPSLSTSNLATGRIFRKVTAPGGESLPRSPVSWKFSSSVLVV